MLSTSLPTCLRHAYTNCVIRINICIRFPAVVETGQCQKSPPHLGRASSGQSSSRLRALERDISAACLDLISAAMETSAVRTYLSLAAEDAAADSISRTSPLAAVADEITAASDALSGADSSRATSTDLVAAIRASIVGDDSCIPTALGPRKITYTDFTASGRSSSMIEHPIANEVLPVYANTHTTTSYTGFQSHCFLSEARDIIRDSLHANEKDDVVLFTGRGATAASNMLVHFLCEHASRPAVCGAMQSTCSGVGEESKVAAGTDSGSAASKSNGGHPGAGQASNWRCVFPGCGRSFGTSADLTVHARTHPDGEWSAWSGGGTNGKSAAAGSASSDAHHTASAGVQLQFQHQHTSSRVVVLVGPYAHHSSFLPWLEAGAEVVHIREDANSGYGIDLQHLLQCLVDAVASQPPSLLVGCFTAASNVTGLVCNMQVPTALMHVFGGVATWDCAAAAPHVQLDVNPTRTYSWVQLSDVITASAQSIVADGSPGGTDSIIDGIQALLQQAQRLTSSSSSAAAPSSAFSARIDALYFSCHKMTGGGAGTPGILCVKRSLFRNKGEIYASRKAWLRIDQDICLMLEVVTSNYHRR